MFFPEEEKSQDLGGEVIHECLKRFKHQELSLMNQVKTCCETDESKKDTEWSEV